MISLNRSVFRCLVWKFFLLTQICARVILMNSYTFLMYQTEKYISRNLNDKKFAET